MILTSMFVVALGACTHKSSKSLEGEMFNAHLSSPSQHNVLLQETRVENERLREELAVLKIYTAKQAGELQSLREKSQSIHHREQDSGRQLQQIRSELLASQAERDQLRKRNVELDGQVSGLPETSQLVSDIQSLNSSFQHIMAGMKQLRADMILIKRSMNLSTDTMTPQQTKHTPSRQFPVSPDRQSPDSKGRILIQHGDTLWELARKYHVSIAQLKAWNGLNSDVIMSGLRLKVSAPADASSTEATPSDDAPAPAQRPKHIKEKEAERQTPSPRDNRVEQSPEPKHILSLGSPNSSESP